MYFLLLNISHTVLSNREANVHSEYKSTSKISSLGADMVFSDIDVILVLFCDSDVISLLYFPPHAARSQRV